MSQVSTTIGNFSIIRRLAIGGMAELLLARAPDGEVVVLKRPLPQFLTDDEYLRMFVDEARIASLLEHANIARIHQLGEADGAPFFTMEYVHGKDLRTLQIAARRRGAGMPLEYALCIVIGVAGALHHAHEQCDEQGAWLGIVHRDVTPANVLVDFEGIIKLIDFGVVKARTRQTETRAGIIKGKIAYMSPEQARGAQVDRRSDIYALGVLLYELTTGTRLHKAASDFELLTQITAGEVPTPSSRLPGYPAGLEAIVMRALSRKADARHATAQELALDLEAFAYRHGLEPTTAGLRAWMRALFADEIEGVPAEALPVLASAPVGSVTPPSAVAALLPPARPAAEPGHRTATPSAAPVRGPARLATPMPGSLPVVRPRSATPVPVTTRPAPRMTTPVPAHTPPRPMVKARGPQAQDPMLTTMPIQPWRPVKPERSPGDPLLSGGAATIEVDDSFEIELHTVGDDVVTSDFERLSPEEIYGLSIAAAPAPAPVPVPVPVPVPSPARAIAAASPSLAVAPVPDSPALTTTLVPMMDVRPIVAADTPALGHGTPRGGVRRADSTARIPVQARRAPRAHTAGAEAAAPIPVPRKRLRTRVVKAALAVAALLAAFALWRASTSGSSASAEPMNVAAHAAPSSLAASASPTLMSVGFVTTEPPSVPPETAQTGGEANDGTPLPAKPRPTRIAPKLRVSGPAWD